MQTLFRSLKNVLLWQRVPAAVIEFKSLERETSLLLGYAVFYIMAGYVLGLAILHFPMPLLGAVNFNQDVWYSIVFKILLLNIIPCIIYFGWWKYRFKDLLLGITPTWKNLLATVFMVSLGFFLNIGHLDGIRERMNHFPDAHLRLLIGALMPLFTAAIPEEFFFRGFLQTRLEKEWNRLSAILISTLLFTAWHLPSRYLLSQGVEGQSGNFLDVALNTGVPVFIIGFIFALHWSRYRNIVLLVLTHWAIDILPSVSSYFKIAF